MAKRLEIGTRDYKAVEFSVFVIILSSAFFFSFPLLGFIICSKNEFLSFQLLHHLKSVFSVKLYFPNKYNGTYFKTW